MYRRFNFFILLVAVLVNVGTASQHLDLLTKAEKQQVVYVAGSGLGLSGHAISDLSLMAVEDGRLVPIPFQFDEYDIHGLVYFEEGSSELDGKAGVLDPADQLLFMLRDAGTEAKGSCEPKEGEVVRELQIQSKKGLRYAYVVRGNPSRSDKYYVRHNIETGETITDFYVLNTDPENELNWLYLNSRENYDKGEPTTIDTFKVEFRGGFLTSFPKVTLTNKNLRPTITGHKSGPIRTVTQLKATLVIAGIPVISQQMQAHRFGWHFEAHAHNKIPLVFRKTVADPSMQVTLDGNAQFGGVTQTARWNNPEGIVVDGKMSREEKKMMAAGVTMSENWILFRNAQNMMLMTMFEAPEAMQELPISMVYDDDDSSKLRKPERFKGHLPDVGYAIEGMPDVSDMIFAFRMLFMDELEGMQPKEFADELVQNPRVNVLEFNLPVNVGSEDPVQAL